MARSSKRASACNTVGRAKWLLGRYKSPYRIPGRTRLGSGCYSVAYRVGDMVIKRSTPPLWDGECFDGFASRKLTSLTRKLFRRSHIKPVKTVQHRGYDIQPYVTPYRGDADHTSDLDLNCNNIGYYRGRLVAFDW